MNSSEDVQVSAGISNTRLGRCLDAVGKHRHGMNDAVIRASSPSRAAAAASTACGIERHRLIEADTTVFANPPPAAEMHDNAGTAAEAPSNIPASLTPGNLPAFPSISENSKACLLHNAPEGGLLLLLLPCVDKWMPRKGTDFPGPKSRQTA